MIIQEAINKAIEGGWKADLLSQPLAKWECLELKRKQGNTCGVWIEWGVRNGNAISKLQVEVLTAEIVLDPSFWQALAKAKEWGGIGYSEDTGKEEWCDALRCPECGEWLIGDRMECPDEHDYDGGDVQPEWLYQWHRLVDHLGNGGTIESFFETL